MNTTKKLSAVLLALVMALTLAACGGGKGGGKSEGSSKSDSNLGKYIGEEVLSSDNEWVPFDDIYDLGSSYIELKEGGKGDFCMEDDIKEIEWTLDNDGKLVLSSYGTTCNGTLKDGLISLDDYFGFDLQMTFRKGGSLVSSSKAEGSLDDFADEYGGDWHGMAGLTDATGDLASLNDTAHEILARLVFDGNGGCEVWLAMYLEGENDFNFIDTRAYVVPDDDTGLELRGEFMGGEMQEGILSVDATGALYVSCEVDSDLVDGSISLLANLRHLDDESWTDDDFIPLPEDAVAYYRGMSLLDIASTYMIDMSLIPDDGSGNAYSTLPSSGGFPENYPFERTTANGEGEYGKSNPDATGLTDLATMQKVRQELWDMSSSKTKHLTYDDIKEMLGGEDGIPHTGMDERSWNSEKHAYGWYNGEGDYYVPYFELRDGDEYYTAATFSSSVRG